MVLGEYVENLWAVCEKTADHLQHIVCEERHAELVNEHFEPLPSGKFPAVPSIAPDHGRQKLVELVMDLN